MSEGLPQMDGQTIEDEFQQMQQRVEDLRENHPETRNKNGFNMMPSGLPHFDGQTVDDFFQDMLPGDTGGDKSSDVKRGKMSKDLTSMDGQYVDGIFTGRHQSTQLELSKHQTETRNKNGFNMMPSGLPHFDGQTVDDFFQDMLPGDTGANKSTDVKRGKMTKDLTSMDGRYVDGIFTGRHQSTQLELSKHQTDIGGANAIMLRRNDMDVERRMMPKRLNSMDGQTLDHGFRKSAPDSRSYSLSGQNNSLSAGSSEFPKIRYMC